MKFCWEDFFKTVIAIILIICISIVMKSCIEKMTDADLQRDKMKHERLMKGLAE